MNLDRNTEEELISTKKGKQSWIDYGVLPCKIQYFLAFMMFGSVMPFLVVFMTSIGLSTSQAGLIAGTRLVLSFAAAQIWGAVIDHTGKRMLFYYILLLGYVGFVFPLPWFAQAMSKVKHVDEHLITAMNTTNITRHNPLLDNGNESTFFWTILCAFFMSAIFETSFFGTQDSIVMNVVNNNKNTASFGAQRMFGSIGFAVGNLIAGAAADSYTNHDLSRYTGIFYVFPPPAVTLFFTGFFLIKRGQWVKIQSKTTPKDKITHLLLQTLLKVPNIVFFTSVLIIGIASAVNYSFLFVFMNEYMDVTSTMMTLAMVVSALSEVIVFCFEEKLISWMGGNIPCIILGAFSYFIRFLLTSFVQMPWLILPIQLLHAFGFGLFWAAAIRHTGDISPAKIHATMFNLTNGLHFGISSVFGICGGGYLYQIYGGREFFRIIAYVMLAWSIFMVVYYYVIERFCFSAQEDKSKIETQLLDTKIQDGTA